MQLTTELLGLVTITQRLLWEPLLHSYFQQQKNLTATFSNVSFPITYQHVKSNKNSYKVHPCFPCYIVQTLFIQHNACMLVMGLSLALLIASLREKYTSGFISRKSNMHEKSFCIDGNVNKPVVVEHAAT